MAAAPSRRRFGPDRIALVPVVVFFCGALPVATSSALLLPLLLAPIACGVWVVRARVVAAPVGVEVCNGLGVRRVAWSDVDGVQVRRRRPARLLLTGGRRGLPMTALGRRDLPRLLEVGEQAASPDAA